MKKIFSIILVVLLVGISGCRDSKEYTPSKLASSNPENLYNNVYSCGTDDDGQEWVVLFKFVENTPLFLYGPAESGGYVYLFEPVGEFTYKLTDKLLGTDAGYITDASKEKVDNMYVIVKDKKIYYLVDKSLSLQEMDEYTSENYCSID